MSDHGGSAGSDPLGRLRSWQLSPAAVRALAVVAVVTAALAAVVAWRARPTVEPVVATTVSASSADASAGPAAFVMVAVSGRVHRPGVVQLPDGARVADAIEAAGGALNKSDLELINLARRVTDGELILVGVTPPPDAPIAGGGIGSGTGSGTDQALVNLNTATSAQLQELPGVGPVLAERIIAYREQHGGFTAVTDLRKVSGIGDARYDELKDRVTV